VRTNVPTVKNTRTGLSLLKGRKIGRDTDTPNSARAPICAGLPPRNLPPRQGGAVLLEVPGGSASLHPAAAHARQHKEGQLFEEVHSIGASIITAIIAEVFEPVSVG
jgi:hypothetical protein